MDELRKSLASPLPKDPELTEHELQVLRAMAQPGGPLYKIFKSLIDYSDHLRDHIAEADLSQPEAVKQARQLQLKRGAARENVAWILSQIQRTPTKV